LFTMKIKLNDFIPPVFTRSLKRNFSSKPKTLSPKFFSNYIEAQAACSSAGYEDFDLIKTVFEKTRLVKEQMLNGKFPLSDSAAQSLAAILLALRAGQKQLKIIDFGGACGTHYFQLRPFLPSDLQLDWVVVETPAMVKKTKTFETGELRFVTSIVEAKENLQIIHLLHSSGALQYVPSPQATIQEFIACQPAYIFLNRLALSASETMITVQESFLGANGPGTLPDGIPDRLCRYPVTYFPKRRCEEMLSQNYRVTMEFADTKTWVGEKEIFVNTGIFAERSP
jgi:putative methyltransferase (TIGR04325 family)